MVRYVLVVCVGATILSCRDIVPFQDTTSIQGYQLNGTVTTANGVPIENVDVLLAFNYDLVSSSPMDTQQVYVTDSLSLVDVAVYTPTFDFVRQIIFDYRTTGPVPRYYWNGRDHNGNLVASGKYLIRYAVDTIVVKYTPWIVEGNLTATTDTRGRFVLAGPQLPVDDVFDIYNTSNTYLGTYNVTSAINLRFTKLTQASTYLDVGLVKDKITSRTFILQ